MRNCVLPIACTLIMFTPVSVNSITCYSCTSVNRSNVDCEDPMSGYVPVARPCKQAVRNHKGLLHAVYCSKIKGIRKRDGTSLTIRHCSMDKLADVFGHSGQFVLDDDLYDGDIATCMKDWCNRGVKLTDMRLLAKWTTVFLPAYLAFTSWTVF